MIGLGLGLGIGAGGALEAIADPPTGVNGAGPGSGTVELSWTDASSAPNGYEWELYEDPSNILANSGTVGFGTSPTNVISSGQTPGNYYFRMRTAAYSGFIASGWVQSGTFTVT